MNKDNKQNNSKLTNRNKIWIIVGIIATVSIGFAAWGISKNNEPQTEVKDCSKAQNEEQCLKERETKNNN